MKFIIIVSFITVIVVVVICAYNTGISLRNYVREAFSTMDVYLKKRWDLIPNLVECVKAYALHEKTVFSEVSDIRVKNYISMSQEEKMNVNNQLAFALPKMIAVAENYPELKSNEHFVNLMSQLEKIEEDIANARKYYNGTVRELNNFLEIFPTNLVGIIFGIKKEKMFEIEAYQREEISVG